MNKKGKTDWMKTGIFIAIAVLVLWTIGVDIPGIPEKDTPVAPGDICAVEDTTVTFAALDFYNNSATGGTHQYLINGQGSWTSVTDAATATLSPGDELQVYWAGTSKHYALTEEVIPCAGTATIDEKVYAESMVDTVQVKNEEGLVIDEGATGVNNETLDTGDQDVRLDSYIRGSTEQSFAPDGAIAVVNYIKTVYDDVTLEGDGITSTAVPVWYSVAATQAAVAFEFPAMVSNSKVPFEVAIDVTAGQDPGATGADDINITWYSKDYYLNEDNNKYELGVTDEDNAAAYVEFVEYELAVD